MGVSPLPATVNDEIVPALPDLEAAARRQQRLAHALQALYLLVLLLAPSAQLVPWPAADRTDVDDRVAAALLIAAVVLRLVLRRVGAETDWVQARRKAEEERSAAWRRAVTATAAAGDSALVRDIGALSLVDRWTIYRAHRIDHQIDYFTRRARERGAASRRWQMLRLLLTAATLGVVVVALVRPAVVPVGTTGLVSALLATVEAWIQFQRSEVIAASYRGARAELAALRARVPDDEAALAVTVDAVELALDRERWIWMAIMSVAALTTAGRPTDR
jgi:hypothetical protein